MDDHNASYAPQDTNPQRESKLPKPIDQPGSSPAIELASHQPVWEKLRRFLACNPFYLVSAALLLYSFYLISAHRTFLPTEVGQLSFNLGSQQLYQILVVITAIFLARRAIWYDSTLLVGLENLLLLVPFILISQAALIDAGLVWSLCAAAGMLAMGRMAFLRRFIAQLNFPPRLFWTGMFVVAVNSALPAIYRVLHESKFGTKPDWGAAYETNQYIWWLLVPALCLLMSVVPCSRSATSELWPQRRWFPLGLFCLWLVGTGVHLYCLGYVYDFALRPELMAPAIWTLFWVLYLRAERLLPGLKERWKQVLWGPALLATLVAAPQPQKVVFLVLAVFNVAIFGWIYFSQRGLLALHLTLISIVALVAGLPEEWGRELTPEFTRETFIGGAAVIYFLVCIALTNNPKLGILGSLVAAFSVAVWKQQPDELHWAAQAGLVFLLLHSLRWTNAEEQGTGLLRWIAAMAWVAHSVAWMHFYGEGWKVCIIAVPVLVTWFTFRWLCGIWGPMAILLASVLVLLSAPGHAAAVQLESAPAGLLAVIGSFVLFGLGTLGAVTKHRWSSTPCQAPR